MERVVALQIRILVSVCPFLVDLELGRSVFLCDNIHIQYWQVLLYMSLFLFLTLHGELDARVSAVQVGCELVHFI